MRRAFFVAVLALVLVLGCEELGNPTGSTGPTAWVEWSNAELTLRTRIETFRVDDLPSFLARFPPATVHLVEPTIRPGGHAGLVTVDVVRAKWMGFGPMITEIELETGQVIVKRWVPPRTAPPWRLLVALDAKARGATTRLR